MAIRKTHITETGYYFITFTCHQWIHLFEIVKAYDLVYKWFDYMKTQNNHVIGYVIMPNHIHILLAYKQHNKSLNIIVGNGKRFLAYGIVERLKQQEQISILNTLNNSVKNSDRKRGKLHEVFEDSFEVKKCESEIFLLQKLNYIHKNPCAKKWMLAENVINYPYSSAIYYETGEQSLYPVVSWTELEEMGWWS